MFDIRKNKEGKEKMKERVNKTVQLKFILFCIIGILCIGLFMSSCKKKADKPLDLGYFTKIGDPSISYDGNQILFDGCGHKDYPRCTIYRFERSTGKLYRYMHKNESELIRDGRYSVNSLRFALMTVPLDVKREQQYSDMQIAIVNQDGSDFQKVTIGEGVKVAPMLSPDEKTIVFFKGQERERGKRTAAGKFDLYKVDLRTGKETQLTRLAFYGVSKPYFTLDGKNIIFEGDSPMRLPNTNDARQFREEYKQRYCKHIILKYPVDGSGIEREPVPIITFNENVDVQLDESFVKMPKQAWGCGPGSKMPMVTNDGSIWFEGYVGASGGIHYYQRFPNGKTAEITYEQLGLSPTKFLLKMAVTPDGRWLATLNEERSTGNNRSIRVLDTKTNEHYELTLHGSVENIFIQ